MSVILTMIFVFGFPFLLKRLICNNRLHLLFYLFLICYVFGVLFVTLGIRSYDNEVAVNLIPMQSFFKLFTGAKIGFQRSGLSGALYGLRWIDYASVSSIVLNILLFLPFGYLVPMTIAKANSLRKIVLCGFLLSTMIEITQLLTHRGWFDVDDIIYNTLGALIGYWLFKKIIPESN